MNTSSEKLSRSALACERLLNVVNDIATTALHVGAQKVAVTEHMQWDAALQEAIRELQSAAIADYLSHMSTIASQCHESPDTRDKLVAQLLRIDGAEFTS